MKTNVLLAEYYNVVIENDASAATKMLSVISKVGVNLLAYKSIYLGKNKTQFTLFAIKNREMATAIKNQGISVTGPFPGIFVHGDDVPGALADIFNKLANAHIIVEESSGIANINNGYGVVLYLNKNDIDKAFEILNKE